MTEQIRNASLRHTIHKFLTVACTKQLKTKCSVPIEWMAKDRLRKVLNQEVPKRRSARVNKMKDTVLSLEYSRVHYARMVDLVRFHSDNEILAAFDYRLRWPNERPPTAGTMRKVYDHYKNNNNCLDPLHRDGSNNCCCETEDSITSTPESNNTQSVSSSSSPELSSYHSFGRRSRLGKLK